MNFGSTGRPQKGNSILLAQDQNAGTFLGIPDSVMHGWPIQKSLAGFSDLPGKIRNMFLARRDLIENMQ